MVRNLLYISLIAVAVAAIGAFFWGNLIVSVLAGGVAVVSAVAALVVMITGRRGHAG